MNNFVYKLKNLIVCVLVFCLLVDTVFVTPSFAGNEVNTDSAEVEKSTGSMAGDTELFYDDARGARVSLWDVDSQSLVYSITMMDFNRIYNSELKGRTTNLPYDEAKNYRRLSNMTKPEIIALGGQLSDEMSAHFYNPNYVIGDDLCEISIPFPEMYAKQSISRETLTSGIKTFYGDATNTDPMLNYFATKLPDDMSIDEAKDQWANGKLCFLIEPIVCIHTADNENWILTCAEVGLLARNGMAARGQKFASGKLSGSAYKALPYGTFKETTGLITLVPPYTGPKTITCACEDWDWMITCLGCLEVSSVASPSNAGSGSPPPSDDVVPPPSSDHTPRGDAHTKDNVLYEDELSMVYQYDWWYPSDATRKLTGSVNIGGPKGFHTIYNMDHEDDECDVYTSCNAGSSGSKKMIVFIDIFTTFGCNNFEY